jgi:predicted Zn-dependent peptidase
VPDNPIQISKINPRVTLVTEEMPWLESATVGYFSLVGSRYENEKTQGLTHLTEHMIFKGTKTKSAKDISRITESLGATVDGFTSKEISGVYTHFMPEHFDALLNLIREMIREAIFDPTELEKEKNVILQEILETNENPQEYAYQLLHEVLFPNHPLSFPISGTPKTLKPFTAQDLIQFNQADGLNRRLCISIAGNIKHSYVLEKLSKVNFKYSNRDYWTPLTPPAQNIERSIIFKSRPDLSQAHTYAGFLTVSLNDSRRYALIVLNTILGGSPSSRLFQRLREQDGSVYTIYTFIDFYTDVGIWSLYQISDIKNRARALQAVYEELQKFKKYGITIDEFKSAVNYCKGMLALSLEDPMSRMMRNAQRFLLLGHTVSIKESMTEFDNLTLDYVNSLLELVKFEEYSGAIVGCVTRDDLGKVGVAPKNIIEKKYNNLEDK